MLRYIITTYLIFHTLYSYGAPSRFEVLKTLKWRAINAMEQSLIKGELSFEERQRIEYTIYKIKSSIGQFTDATYFEDIYQQTYQLVLIKQSLENSNERNEIDNLIDYYQGLLHKLHRES